MARSISMALNIFDYLQYQALRKLIIKKMLSKGAKPLTEHSKCK